MPQLEFLLCITLAIVLTILSIVLIIKNYKEKNINQCMYFSFALGIQFQCWYQIIKLFNYA